MSRLSRRGYAQAEQRLKRGIALRRAGLPHDYPGRGEDLETMVKHHQRLGEIPPEKASTPIGGDSSAGARNVTVRGNQAGRRTV